MSIESRFSSCFDFNFWLARILKAACQCFQTSVLINKEKAQVKLREGTLTALVLSTSPPSLGVAPRVSSIQAAAAGIFTDSFPSPTTVSSSSSSSNNTQECGIYGFMAAWVHNP